MKTIKLFVQDTDNSFKLLEYFDERIVDINNLGIYVSIKTKIPDYIKNVPSIDINDSIIEGTYNIINFLEKFISQKQSSRPAQKEDKIDDYWSQQLFSKGKDGSLIPRNDEQRPARMSKDRMVDEDDNIKGVNDSKSIGEDDVDVDDVVGSEQDDKMLKAWMANNATADGQ